MVMWPLTWIRNRRQRHHSRAEVEAFLEEHRPGGSDLEKLRLLIGLIFWNCRDPREVVIARARHRGIRSDRIDQLLRGDVASGFRWEVIEDMLTECGGTSAQVEVARDLFYDFPRIGPHQSLTAITHPAGVHPTQSAAPPQGGTMTGSPAAGAWIGQNCSVLLTDVTGFGAPHRTDDDRRVIRKVMYGILKQALESAGISWDDCRHEDRGDGVLIVIPSAVPTRQVVHPFLARLADGLARHYDTADDGTKFQLRAALDVGPVESDDEGVTGETIINAARLIEAPILKQRLRKTPACLGFIASDFVYDRFIKHRAGQIDLGKYHKIKGGVKGSRFTAWIYLAPDTQDEHPGDAADE
jgi:hypothetical protein